MNNNIVDDAAKHAQYQYMVHLFKKMGINEIEYIEHLFSFEKWTGIAGNSLTKALL